MNMGTNETPNSEYGGEIGLDSPETGGDGSSEGSVDVGIGKR
jgi:hypothetical protein